MTLRLRFLNAYYHVLHGAIILFIVGGWILPAARPFHLLFLIVTLGSWLILGYCPVTEAHWRVRRAAGLACPGGPYIPFLAAALLGRPVNVARLDRNVVAFTLCVAALSLGLNAARWF